MATIMTIKIDRKKITEANLEYLRTSTLLRCITMIMRQNGFKPTGNGTWEHEEEDVAKIAGNVMLDLEDEEAIDYLAEWKIKATHQPYVFFGEYDLIEWYNERRRPFYESVIKPQKEIQQKIQAAQLKAQILRKIGKLKDTDDTEEDA